MIVKIDNVISSFNDFPTLPTIYTKLFNSISNPRSTVNDVAELIIKDQSTTIRLLKLVNSPVFGVRNKVTNVTQAIFLLGFNEVKNLVLSLSIMDIFKKVDDNGSQYLINLWKHSVAVATISKILGNKVGINNTEDFFVSGIIHDIGVLFLLFKYKEIYSKLIEKSIAEKISLEDLEKEVFGMTRHVIGDLLVEKWKLPSNLRNVVRHSNSGVVDGKVDEIVACVHLADIIAKILNLHYIDHPTIPAPKFQIWSKLNFDKNVIKGLYPLIIDSFNASVGILKLEK